MRGAGRTQAQAEVFQKTNLFICGNEDTQQLPCFMVPQHNLLWSDWFGISIHDSVGELATGSFQNQLRRALAGPITNASIRAAFESIAGFAAQPQCLARAANVGRIE